MKLDAGSSLLSDLVFVRTYSEKKSTGKKERAWETIDRVRNMHVAKFPHLEDKISEVFKSVHDLTAVPSMRSMQFAGYSIDRSNIRIFNCAYSPIEAFKDIADIAYISMNGAGVGYSVQGRHVYQLPIISLDILSEAVIIQDTKESWADSILSVLQNPAQQFLYHQIRPKGSRLSTGGTASGPDSLMMLHDFIRTILLGALGRKLRPIEVHDIMCHTGDLVFCGGVRRTALNCLFDVDDEEMLTCKYGDWWIDHPQRARACNSAVIHRDDPAVEGKIRNVMQHCFNSNAGEPTLFLTNDYDWGINPCFTGDTLVAVADGRNAVPIRQLAEENYSGPVYSVQTQTSQVVSSFCSKVWLSKKNATLVRVTLDDGSSFRCTPDHRIMLRDGQYVQAKDLKKYTSLMPFNSYKRKDRNYRIIQSNTGRDAAQYAHVAQYYDIIKDGYNKQHLHHKDEDGFNDLPSNLETIDASDHNRQHMLAGQNACFRIKDMQSYKERMSIATHGVKNGNSNGMTSEEMYDKVYAKTLEEKRPLAVWEILNSCRVKHLSNGRLQDMGVSSLKELAKVVFDRINHKVAKVENCVETEDVFDMQVEGTHNFAIITSNTDSRFIDSSGVFVHNCGEVGLRPRSFCNLSEINAASCDSVDTFSEAIRSATAIGTLQASYTNFDYLDARWKKNCEEEALLGVSITGQAEAQHLLTPENLRMGAAIAIETNRRWAEMLGINPANRIGCTKPSGSTSAWLGTTSGVHGAHSDYFLRRVRVDRMANAPIVKYLIDIFGESEPMTDGIIERDAASPDLVVVTVPIRMDGAIKRSEETAIELLERAKCIYDNWIVPSHVQGENHHNVSLTVSYREHEKREIIDWVVKNRDSTSGVSFLPYSNTSYKQMPFQSVTKAEYEWWVSRFPEGIDLFSLDYRNEVDQRKQEASCSANGCEIY